MGKNWLLGPGTSSQSEAILASVWGTPVLYVGRYTVVRTYVRMCACLPGFKVQPAMCVCVCVCTCTYACVCMCVFVCVLYVHIVCVCVCVCVCVRVHTMYVYDVCVCVCV